ncbi:MAG: serine protease [Pseudomonadota bacterium]
MTTPDQAQDRSWTDLISRKFQPSIVHELGPEQGSPVQPETITVDDMKYVSIRLLHFEHPYVRRVTTNLRPAVYARASWITPLEGEQPIERIFDLGMPDGDGSTETGQIAFRGRTFFGPAIFNGSIEFDLGMFVYRNNKIGREFMDIAANAGKAAAIIDGAMTGTAIGIAKSVLQRFMQDGKSLHLGISAPLPMGGNGTGVKTGCWAVLPGRHKLKLDDVRFDPDRNRLLRTGKRPVKTPYIVYAIEAATRNPNASRIPEINTAWANLQNALRSGDRSLPALEKAFQHYRLTVLNSRKLTFEDQDALIAQATQRFERQKSVLLLESATAPDVLTLSEVMKQEEVQSALPGLETTPSGPEQLAKQAHSAIVESTGLISATSNLASLDETTADVEDESDRIARAIRDLVMAAVRSREDAKDEIIAAATAIRKNRRWRQIAQLGSELRGAGIEYTRLTYLNAAALVETGQLQAGEAMVSRAQLMARREADAFNQAESLALRGRIYKQRYVAALQNDDEARAKTALQTAIEFYQAGAEANTDPNDHFQNVNVLACLAAAERRAWKMQSKQTAAALAKRIYKDLTSTTRNAELTVWDYGNVAEAATYLGNEDEAADWLERYRAHDHVSPFALNATRRQFVEIWEIDPQSGTALSKVLTRMAVGAMASETSLTLTSAEVSKLASLALEESAGELADLEAVFDNQGATPVRHLLRAVAMGKFVGAIRRANGRAVGTGFIMRGDLISDHWRGEYVFLTNDHVISEDPKLGIAVHPDEARISFLQTTSDQVYRIESELWRSSYKKHDVAIFRLNKPVPDELMQAEPFEIARGLPPRWRTLKEAERRGHGMAPPKVFVIGHPSGRDLEITVENNLLIDHGHNEIGSPAPPEPVPLHYRAPTEPGSSGSPIFNARTLELIGIHHMGNAYPLPGYKMPSGVVDYEANQGHWIQAIRASIHEHLSSPMV